MLAVIVVVTRVAAVVTVGVLVRAPDVVGFNGLVRIVSFDRVMVRVDMMVRRATVMVDVHMGVPVGVSAVVDRSVRPSDTDRCKQHNETARGDAFGPIPHRKR